MDYIWNLHKILDNMKGGIKEREDEKGDNTTTSKTKSEVVRVPMLTGARISIDSSSETDATE